MGNIKIEEKLVTEVYIEDVNAKNISNLIEEYIKKGFKIKQGISRHYGKLGLEKDKMWHVTLFKVVSIERGENFL